MQTTKYSQTHTSYSSLCLLFIASILFNTIQYNTLRASQLVQVVVSDSYQYERLFRAGLDITASTTGGLTEVILMDDADRARLVETGIPFFVSVDNIEAYNRSRLQPGRDDMGGYRTLDEIYEEMNRLHEAYSDIISEPIEIGRTVEDRPVLALKVSDNPDDEEDEPELFVASLIHPREVATSYVLFGAIERLAEGYGEDEWLTHLVDDRQTWFIPVVNPDGYAYNEDWHPEGGGMWRKNRVRNQDGSYGVDLNRNFGSHWGYDNIGSSSIPGNETYRGPEAFSEVEARNIRDLVNDHHFSISMFFHSWGNICLYPYGYEVLQPEDRSLFSALSQRMVADSDYIPGTGWEVIYRTNGDTDDWLYSDDGHDPVLSFTMEIGSRRDYFWPPLNRVQPLVDENVGSILAAIEFADIPSRVLSPATPEISGIGLTPGGLFSLRWNGNVDELNRPISYRIKAKLPGDPIVDDAPEDQNIWDLTNVILYENRYHSAELSYKIIFESPMALMTTKEPFVAPDTITAWMYYNIRSNRSHCLALEASYDGYSWEALSGDKTADFTVHNQSIGHGISGISEGWEECHWLTGDYAGQVIKLRFRYYSFDRMPVPAGSEYCYIDDIAFFPTYEDEQIIAEGIRDNRWDGWLEEVNPGMVYTVEASDIDGDVSFFSTPQSAEIRQESLLLDCGQGWSLISAPFIPAEPSLEAIFTTWLDNESIAILKDGWGNFFLPSMNFNQIGSWNPTLGYLIKMDQADTLTFPGDRIPRDTPIPAPRGWMLIGYLPSSEMEPEIALASISDHLIIAKNSIGEFWRVDQNFSNLPPIQPGEALSIKMAEFDTLIYPEPQEIGGRERSIPGRYSHHFAPASPENMSLLLDLVSEHESGMVLFYDETGNVSGSCEVDAEEDVIGIAAWKEDVAGGRGFRIGESINAVWRSPDGVETTLALSPTLGKAEFQTDEFARLTASFDSPPLPMALDVGAFPNPFNGRSDISISIAQDSDISMQIIDVAGRMITQKELGLQAAGLFRVSWDASDLPDGIYFVNIQAVRNNSFRTSRLKVVLIK